MSSPLCTVLFRKLQFTIIQHNNQYIAYYVILACSIVSKPAEGGTFARRSLSEGRDSDYTTRHEAQALSRAILPSWWAMASERRDNDLT